MAAILSNVISNSPDASVVRNPDGSFTVTHAYGTDTFSPSGAQAFTRNPLFVALPYSEYVQTSYPFTFVFRDSLSGQQKLINWTINIKGEDDAPVISGVTTGNVVEDGTLIASGTIVVNDPDRLNGVAYQSGTQAATVAGQYGSLTITASGQWVYSLDNRNAAVQALPAGATMTDTIKVTALDGKTQIPVMVTITGVNDVATVTSATASLVEKGTPDTASGKLVVTDVDTGEAILGKLNGTAFTGSTTLKGTYGTLTLAADGAWSYKLDNSASATIALKGGQQVTESFTVTSKDGTGTGAITINVTGTNDAPVISGAAAGAVTENNGTGPVTTTGTLVITDPDAGESGTQAGNYNGTYGKLTLDATGHWTYTLTQSPDIIALLTGDKKTDVINVKTTDGTVVPVTVTINGLSSQLNISAGTGNVAEDSVATATGTLTGNTAT
ncbi:VCBS domain-containing protein, partial [Amphibiibacter pelophylacis]